jgi:hypothetical protein
MALGDKNDMAARLKALLPNGWFGDSTPVLDAVLNGIGSALALIYGLISYAALQTRISTATDGFLDLISFDFFGSALPRRQAEMDTPFRARILTALLLERATRAGLIKTLVSLTGRAPKIFEPALPSDTGSYNTNSLGYNVAGGYGSLALPYQVFVIAYRPSGSGIPFIAGYGNPEGAYNTASQTKYASLGEIVGNVTDADIFNAIDSVMPAGTTAWTRLSN